MTLGIEGRSLEKTNVAPDDQNVEIVRSRTPAKIFASAFNAPGTSSTKETAPTDAEIVIVVMGFCSLVRGHVEDAVSLDARAFSSWL